MEIAILMEVLDKYEMLDQQTIKKLESQFMLKADQCNAQDLATFFKILTNIDYKMEERTSNKLRELSDFLFLNIDANCLRKMFVNFAKKVEMGIIKQNMAELLIRKFQKLKKKEEIRGINLTEIQKELSKIKDENLRRKIKKAD